MTNIESTRLAIAAFNAAVAEFQPELSITLLDDRSNETDIDISVDTTEPDNYQYDCTIHFHTNATCSFYDSENDTTTEYPSVFHLFTHLAADLAYNFDD